MQVQLKNWWVFLIKGIVLMVLASLLFGRPADALKGILLFFGLGFILSGVVLSLAGIIKKQKGLPWKWNLAEGIIDLIVGLLFIARPESTPAFLILMLGIWFIFIGASNIYSGFALKKAGFYNWWIESIWGIVGLLFGLMIVLYPLAGAQTLIWLLGVSLFIGGVFHVLLALFIKERSKKVGS